MQYKHVHTRLEQLAGSSQVVMWNSSSIDACYPCSCIGSMAGQCRVNHSNASRTEFPLFDKLVDSDIRPYSVHLQPGQSLDIPALWMYELIAKSQSVAIIREFPDIPLSVIDDLSSKSPFEDDSPSLTDDRLFSALVLFLTHFKRRLSFPTLMSSLVETRYGSRDDPNEITMKTCNGDGITSSGTTTAQHVRKQASMTADAVQELDEGRQQLASQDFIEKMLAVTLPEGTTVESFLKKLSRT